MDTLSSTSMALDASVGALLRAGRDRIGVTLFTLTSGIALGWINFVGVLAS
jgi:hypothetical protein